MLIHTALIKADQQVPLLMDAFNLRSASGHNTEIVPAFDEALIIISLAGMQTAGAEDSSDNLSGLLDSLAGLSSY